MAAARTLLADNPVLLADRTARGALSAWQQSISPRVALQAEVVWPGMADGYLRGGASDVARPFTVVWWRLGPVKTQHCDDCPHMAFNSPYGGPGSGNNELWQVPGDGRTACGAGCHCSLELGWEDMPGSGRYDWTDFFPPDMPRINPQFPLPTSEAATPGLLPGGVPHGPLGVAPTGEYAYPGTATEQAYRAQMDIPHVSPYGTIREGLSVAPPPGSVADLTPRQRRALDRYRAAWYSWDAVRGNLPAAPTLFGERAPGVLVAMTGRRWLVRDQFPSWDALTPEQQAALQDVYDAVTGWNAATGSGSADAAVTQIEADVRDLVGASLAEPRDWTRSIALYSVDQPRGKGGKWTVWHGQLQHQAGNPRGIHEHLVARHGESGGGGGAGGRLRQEEQQRAMLGRLREQHATMTRWLATHKPADDPAKYGRAQDLHARLTTMIAERDQALQRGQGGKTTVLKTGPLTGQGRARGMTKAAYHASFEPAVREAFAKGARTGDALRQAVPGLPKRHAYEWAKQLQDEAGTTHEVRYIAPGRKGGAALRAKGDVAIRQDLENLAPGERLPARQARYMRNIERERASALARYHRQQAAQQGDQQQTMAEPADGETTIQLGYPNQPRNKGKYASTGWTRQTEGGRRQAQHEAGNPRGIGEHVASAHGAGGGGGDARERLGRGVTVEWGGRAGDRGRAQGAFRHMLGRELADHEVASLVGARPGDHVMIRGVERTGLPELGGGHPNYRSVLLHLEGGNGNYTAERMLYTHVDVRTGRFQVVMSNETFYVSRAAQGHGIGTEVIARQVAALDRLGVAHLVTFAVRGSQPNSENGYWTWARMGYDGIVPRRAADLLPNGFHEVQGGRVQALMAAPRVTLFNGSTMSGRDFWQRYGASWTGHFDTQAGSESRRILRDYLREKGMGTMADDLQLRERRREREGYRLTEGAPPASQEEWLQMIDAEERRLAAEREARLAHWRALGFDTSDWVERGDAVE